MQITIPAWTESTAEEGVVANWFVREGAIVHAGQVLGELMVEKAVIEIDAPQDGLIQGVRVHRGDVVKPGMLAAELIPLGEAVELAHVGGSPAASASTAVAGAQTAMPSPPSPPAPPTPAVPSSGATFVPATPAARRLARELGIDLARVVPADGQRVTEEDVRRAAGAAAPTPLPAAAEAEEAGEPLSGRRKVIAARMLGSLRDSAQLTLITDVRADALVAAQNRAQAAQQDFSYTAALGWIVARALQRHPEMNATIEGDRLRRHTAIHLGLAVAVPDGLLVPVVRDAGTLSLQQLTAQVQTLTQRARANQCTPAELTGSTFSLTTLGVYEIDAFTPILNPPEVGILGIGRIREAIVPRDGLPALGYLMALSLTFDHRAVDGAPAAAFLQTVKRLVEDPATYAQET